MRYQALRSCGAPTPFEFTGHRPAADLYEPRPCEIGSWSIAARYLAVATIHSFLKVSGSLSATAEGVRKQSIRRGRVGGGAREPVRTGGEVGKVDHRACDTDRAGTRRNLLALGLEN